MGAYFMKSTAACALWMLAITTTTWSDTSGEKTKKCNINEWYLKKTGEGLFSAELTEKQKTIKSEIEDLIQKSSNDKSLSKVDCSVLETYESKLTNTDSSDTDTVDEDSDADDEELDETEMMDDETDEDELDSCDGDDEIDDDSPETDDESDETSEENMTLEEDNASKSDKRTSAKSPSVVWNCLKQKPNRTSRSCVLLNVFSKRCSLFELPDQKEAQADAPDDVKTGSFRDSKTQRDSVSEREATTKTKPTDATDKKSRRIDSSRKEKNKDSVRTKGQLKDSHEKATTGGKSADTTNKKSRSDDLNKKQKDKETSNARQQQKDSLQKDDQQTATSSPPDESSSKQTGESSTESDADSNAEKLNRGDSGANGFDVNQFQELIEKTAGEYMMKIQSLETQIMRLENDLLVEKLNKQNHSSSFTRLENQILKLENELLKMNLSYEELKEENENIMKKQKSFLELDYVKRPGDHPQLPDNSTKHIEMISQHQNKISELTDHLRNQTLLIDKIRGQSDSLEDQNRVLFQIVMNQTMLISQMMKKVESLTDSNLKHHMQQKLLHDRLDIALASNHALEDLQAIVSDAFPTEAKGASSSKGSDGGMKRKTPQTLSLSRCKHPSRNKVTCRFSSTVLNQCLWNENDTVTVPSKFQQLERKQDKPVPVDKKTKDLKSTEAPKDESVKSRPKEAPNKKESTKQRSTEKQDKTGGKRAGSEKSKKAEQASKESDPKVSKPSEEEKDSKKVSSKDEVKKTAEKEKVKISEESKTESKDPKASAEEEKKAQKPDKEEVDKEETKHTASKDMESDERKSVKSDMPKSNDKKTDDPRSKDRKQVAEKKKPESKQKEKTSTAKSETKDTKDSKELKPKTGGEKDKGSTSKKTKKSGQGERKVERIPPLYNATKQLDPKDCMGHYRPNKRDGQYKIKLHDRGKTLSVFCDMKNGGWTVIQRRQDGTVNFFKSWQEYKAGFGGIYGEHWLGNDNIHRLTNQDQYELRVDLMDWNRSKKFALYDYVRVDSEEDGYRLHVEGYSGDAGDGLSKHNGEKFSTKDRDNDRLVKEFNGSCANRFKGAWWYYKCYASNLNGKYYKNGNIPEKLFDGITWKPWTGPSISLRKVEIKIRPIQPKN